MLTRHLRVHALSLLVGGAALLTALSPARAELKPVHATLRSSRAQANREQVFRYLMDGTTPTWMQGKSAAKVRSWGNHMRKAIYRNAEKIVRDIVANPSASPAKREQMILGLVSPIDRARLLKDVAGFKVDKVKYKVNGRPTTKYKVRLERHGYSEWGYGDAPAEFSKQMSIYNRVMSPNVITYAPAGGHSKYVSRGKVLDLYFNSDYGALRPNNKPLFPVWLSDGEAARMKQVFDVGNTNWSYAMGEKVSHGHAGMWPPTETQRAKTGNSCTTTFIRAPVGERQAQYAWIDALQGKVAKAAKDGRVRVDGANLADKGLLDAITGKNPEQYRAVFDQLRRQMPAEARNLDKLQRQVDFFVDKLGGTQGGRYNWQTGAYEGGTKKCAFPLDLMHRTPLSTMANIKGDPMGPGMATQKFRAADPTRIGTVTVFNKQ